MCHVIISLTVNESNRLTKGSLITEGRHEMTTAKYKDESGIYRYGVNQRM